MTAKDLIKQLKTSIRCYVYVRMTDDDGMYVQAVKADLLGRLSKWKDTEKVNAWINSDGDLIVG